MKTITIIVLCNIISISFIHAQKCYVCDQSGCDRPGVGNIQDCSDAGTGGTSGKSFVDGALAKNNPNGVYSNMESDLNTFISSIAPSVNRTALPTWKSLTQWVCYVTKDKRRGCLLMGKGLCSGDKTWLGQITTIADKISGIMQKAKNTVTKMFTDGSTASLSDEQKSNISNWFAEQYMTKLVNNSNDPQYQLESCCEGDACNFASMIQKSTAMLILLFLSAFILV